MMHITSSSDKKIEEFTHLKESTLLSRNLALVESEKIYLKLIHNNIHIVKVLCLKSFAEKYSLTGENIFICERDVLNSIAGFKTEFDVITLFERSAEHKLDQLDDKIILLNGLSSPENVGAIVRTAAAFNINSLIYDAKTCSPFLRRCIRVSMGNIFSIKTHHSKNLLEDLRELQQLGYTIFSTANIPNAVNYTNFNYPQKSVLIIGSEGHGVEQIVLDASDKILFIPINDQVAHLNAANAASIFLSQFNK